jgi:hypothetical protein
MAHLSLSVLGYAAQILTHFGFDYLLGGSSGLFCQGIPRAILFPAGVLGAVMIALFAAGWCGSTVWAARRIRRPESGGTRFREESGKLICWLWVSLPFAGYIALSVDKPIYPHYLIILYPVPFWFAAAALDWLAKRGRRWRRNFATGLILATVLFQVLFLTWFTDFIGRYGGTTGDYGVAYRHKLEVARNVASLCRTENAKAALMCPSGRCLADYSYLVILCGGETLARVNPFDDPSVWIEIVEKAELPLMRVHEVGEPVGRSFEPVAAHVVFRFPAGRKQPVNIR